jgi:hypothetical protein
MVAVLSQELMDKFRGEGLRNESRVLGHVTRAWNGCPRGDNDADVWPAFRDDAGELETIKLAGHLNVRYQ